METQYGNKIMISKLIRKLFFITLVVVIVPVFFGLVVFFWVIGAMTSLFATISNWLDDE
jgi:uncharacterized membrane protein